MSLGKTTAAVLVFVGALLVPATTAQATAPTAASASCAPTQQDRWLGTYRGPHYYDSGEEYGVLDITVYVENGNLRIMHLDGWSSPGVIHAPGVIGTGGGWFAGVEGNSTACGSDGRVTEMTGVWWLNYNPECATCVIHGPFEVVRIQ